MAELNDVVADVVEEAGFETAEVIRSLTKVKISFAALGAAAGMAAGALVAYKIAYKKADAKYAEIADREITDIRNHYMAKVEAVENRAKPALVDIVTGLGYTNQYSPEEQDAIDTVTEEEVELEEEVHIDPVASVRNVFEEAKEDAWDYAKEVKARKHAVPYVIHADEYNNNEREYMQIVLTYYEGDDVLSDHQDNIIDDQEHVVGLDNLTKFGHGSGDPTVVYVRNEYLEQEMEINLSKGTYAEEVHGFTHSDGPRRPRLDWDG